MSTEKQLELAEVLMSQGRTDEARTIYDELCRMEHLTAVERGSALFGLGACYFLQGAYGPAAPLLRESRDLLLAVRGFEDPLTTRTSVLLSRALIALGDLESGVEIGRGALKNLVELYGKDAEQTASAAFFLASGVYRSGCLAEAEDLTTLAMHAWETVYGVDSLQVATCLDALAKLREDCGQMSEAGEFLQRSLGIREKVLGENELTADSLGRLGMFEFKAGHRKQAADLLTRALALFDKLGLPREAEHIAAFNNALAACLSEEDKENGNG